MSKTEDNAWMGPSAPALVTTPGGMLVGVAVDWNAGRVLLQLDTTCYRLDFSGAIDLSEMLAKAGRDGIRGGGTPPEDR